MTLGEFRHITAELPDEAEFVDVNEEQCDYRIHVTREYDTSVERQFGPPRGVNCTIAISSDI